MLYCLDTLFGHIPKISIGFIVEEADVNGMAEAIIKVARNPDLAGRLGKAAKSVLLRILLWTDICHN